MSALPAEIEAVALLGWACFPTSRSSKASMFKGALEAATCNLDTLEGWARNYRGCNWRIGCGASGLFGLDVDRPGTHRHDGFAALAALIGRHGEMPPRPMTRTGGSGGAVLIFQHAGERLVGSALKSAPGIDPHRGPQAIAIPPSRHPVTGGAYTWRVAPWDVAPPPIPVWLAKLYEPPPEPVRRPWVPTERGAEKRLMRAVELIAGAPSGAANITLNKQAFALGGWAAAGLVAEADAVAALYCAAKSRAIPDREARDTIRSGWLAGLRRPAEGHHA